MKAYRTISIFSAGLILLFTTFAEANSTPVVGDVTASQRTDGSKLVDIRYNLYDADNDKSTVLVQVSSNGGDTWTVPAVSFIGDVGTDISPGTGKLIVWECAKDLLGVYGINYKVKITADDGYELPVSPNMALIPGGTFAMGDNLGDSYIEDQNDENPVHTVTVDSFYMDKYEMTNGQYCAYLNSALSQGLIDDVFGGVYHIYYCGEWIYYIGISLMQIQYNDGVFSVQTKSGRDMSNDPVVNMTWYDAVLYCNWRSEEEGYEKLYNPCDPNWTCDFSKKGYRLPTEAEREYAARGGASGSRFPWGDTISHSQSNHYSVLYSAYTFDLGPKQGYHPDWNDGVMPYTSPVGSFAPNGFGLYDMAGNVWEWCNDWYDPDYYNYSPTKNPTGPARGGLRVIRGGSWGGYSPNCRNSNRGWVGPGNTNNNGGFRVVLNLGGDIGSKTSGRFTIDNRCVGIIYQRAKGIFLSGVSFNNTFRAIVNDWGEGAPGTVTFALNGESITIPYGEDGAETSEFDMGALPSAECAITSNMLVTAKDSNGTKVGQSIVSLRCMDRPRFMPQLMIVKPLSPFEWNQEIVYQIWPQVSYENLDATWYGKNVLFENYGGEFSGGKLDIEFNGAKGEYTFKILTDISIEPNPWGALWKPLTNTGKISLKKKGTLSVDMYSKAKINLHSGCFDGGPIICAGGQFGSEWKIKPIGPLFGIPLLWFTGKADYDIGLELCSDPMKISPENVLPLTGVDIIGNLTGQGGLELGIPFFISVFGGLEGNASGKVHIGEPIPTCWGPYIADLNFDLSIVGYARLAFTEWELGRFVIVKWSCPTSGLAAVFAIPIEENMPTIRKAGRPYLNNVEPYSQFVPKTKMVEQNIILSGSGGETDESIVLNVNLEAAPAISGRGNLTLLATSEDDPCTIQFVEHDIHAVFRDSGVWGTKVKITNNNVPDILPATGFDASDKALIAWTTVPGVTGTENFNQVKAKMEIAYSKYERNKDIWSSPVQLTSDGTSLDALPQIVNGADGSTSLIWLHSSDNSLPIAPGEPLGNAPDVMVSRWNGTKFGAPQVLYNSCDALGPVKYARSSAGCEVLLWTRDVDANMATVEDREIVESHTVGGIWTSPEALTSNGYGDIAVGLLSSGTDVIAYYVCLHSGGMPGEPEDQLIAQVFNGSAWSAESVQITTLCVLSPSFILSPTNAVTCVFIGQSNNESCKAIFYTSSPNGTGNWSQPQEMATGPVPCAPTSTYTGNNIQVAYVSARPSAMSTNYLLSGTMQSETAFDVRFLDHTPYTDIWLENSDINIEPNDPNIPLAGQDVTVSIKIHLSGDYEQSGVKVFTYNGDPCAGGILIDSNMVNLIPGSSAVVHFNWIYPSEPEKHMIYTIADPCNSIAELNEENNMANTLTGTVNLRALSLGTAFSEEETVGIEITFRNTGITDINDVNYELRRDSIFGPLITSGTIKAVYAGEIANTTIPWDVSLTEPGTYEIYLLLDPYDLIEETEESDNEITGIIMVLPDLQAVQWSAHINDIAAYITIRNVGSKPSEPNIVRVTYKGEILGEAAIGTINPGESDDVSIPILHPVSYGRVEITVNPDSGGSDELTLLNNTIAVILFAPADFEPNGNVDVADLEILCQEWLQTSGKLEADIAPVPKDGIVNFLDFAVFAQHWLESINP